MGLTYKEERIEDVVEEIKPLLDLHWKELANNQDVRALDVDFDMYIKLNDLGTLKFFAVRDSGKLIGYFCFYISYHLHYRGWKCAASDVYYLDPAYRNGVISKGMFKEMEAWLKSLEVNSIVLQEKIGHPHGDFFKSLGFNLVERVYEKVV